VLSWGICLVWLETKNMQEFWGKHVDFRLMNERRYGGGWGWDGAEMGELGDV
jgi:hypothetical protein